MTLNFGVIKIQLFKSDICFFFRSNMAVAFSSNDEASIERSIETFQDTNIENIDLCFEIERCVEWIRLADLKTVALQFPDSLIKYSPHVASAIESKLDQK